MKKQVKKQNKGQIRDRQGLHQLYDEPAINFKRPLPQPEFSVNDINKWAKEYLEEARQFVQWAKQTEDAEKKREIYSMSIGLNKLLEIYFGYRSGNSKNEAEKIIEKFWYDLRDESILVEEIWTAIQESILAYDNNKESSFSSYLYENIRMKVLGALKDRKNKLSDHQIPTSCLSTIDENGDYIEFDATLVEDNYSVEVDEEIKELVENLLAKISKDKKSNTEKQRFILEFIVKDMVLGYAKAEAEAFRKQKETATAQPKIRFDKKFPQKRLAELLTEKFGGTVKSNEVYVNRFRKQAEKALGRKLNTTYTNDKKVLKERNMKKFFNQETYEKNKLYSEYLDKFKRGLVGHREVI